MLEQLLIQKFLVFVLVLFRLGGVFVIIPFPGGSQVPRRVRVLLAVTLSLAVFPVVSTSGVRVPTAWVPLTMGIASELVLGLICGFVVNLVFVAAQMGGTLLSRHMGTALARVINPLFETPTPVFGQFFFMFAVVVFVAVNGHHVLLRGLIGTFDRVPLMGARFSPAMVPTVAGLMGDMFILMIQLAAPTFVALFMVTVALGIIARTVPQINVLIVGFPLKMCLGLVVTALALAGAALLLEGAFEWIMRQVDAMLRFMTPA
jgi:flagellar biosynthetic protein FliR